MVESKTKKAVYIDEQHENTKYEWIGSIRNNEMKISKSQLKQLVKEELGKTMNEWESESAATNRMMKQAQRKRFTGGQVDIEPLSDEEQDASSEAYYELYNVLLDSELPGVKPSDKLKYALRWIAKFEQGAAATDEDKDDFFSDREANPHDDSMYGEPEGGY